MGLRAMASGFGARVIRLALPRTSDRWPLPVVVEQEGFRTLPGHGRKETSPRQRSTRRGTAKYAGF